MNTSSFNSNSIPKAFFTFSVPVVIGLIITVIYNITDTYFIALTKNTNLVAGVSLCAPLFTLIMGIGNIFGQGGTSVISRLLGQGDTDNIRKVSSYCFYIAIALGFVATALMLLLKVPVLTLLGADAETLPHALPYYTWFAIGAPIVLLSFIHTGILRAEGMANQSMIAVVGGSVINIILDPILIFTFGLGSGGAAIATVIGYFFTDIYCLIVVLKKSHVLSVKLSECHALAAHRKQVVSIGLSSALSNITQSICLIFTNQALLTYGNDKIAAMGIVQKLCMITSLVIVGFAVGGAPLIGYTYGIGDMDRLKRLTKFVIKFLIVTALVLSLILIFFAPQAMSLFTDDPSLAEAGVLMLRTQLYSMVLMSVVLYFTAYFQATGKAGPALILALSRQGIVFVVVLVVAANLFGYYGIVWTQFFSDAISIILAIALFLRVNKTIMESAGKPVA